SLHKRGIINYLGCVRFKKEKLQGTFIAKEIRNSYLDANNNFDITNYLVEDRLNVLSDEKFTLPAYYNELQHGSKVKYSDFIDHYISKWSKKITIRVLISLRNQPDLIYSQFIQKIIYLNKIADISNFDSFNLLFFNNVDKFKVYDYNQVLENLTKYISKESIYFIIFEDLRSGSNDYYDTLKKALDYKGLLPIEQLDQQEFRSRQKNDIGVKVKVFKPRMSILKSFISYTPDPLKLSQKMTNRLFIQQDVIIPFLNDEEREDLLTYYSEKNKIFWGHVDIPMSKGINYGYFK
ncbi:MAG: hypothetical protein WBN28_03915, partial [Lutimonas sp.]